MLEQYKRRWIVGGTVAALAVILLGTYLVVKPGPTSDVVVHVVPGDLMLRIDGVQVQANVKVEAREGEHELVAERSGFATETRKFTVANGDPLTIDVALEPNSDEGSDRYKKHPDEQLAFEAEAGKQAFDNARTQQQRYTIMAKLPYIAGDFRMDPGVSKAHQDDPTAVAFYIRLFSPAGRQKAEEWIRLQGIDPTTLELIYIQT
jgi:hypothetical protein